jgi:pyruvate ferredoxin oxidoreductase alpha subunit
MVGPEAFSEVKYLMHKKQMQALEASRRIAGEFAGVFGRASGGPAC